MYREYQQREDAIREETTKFNRVKREAKAEEKLLIKINNIILQEISSMSELEQQIIFDKKQNPFINLNLIAEKYHIPLHKIKKILYSFRQKVIAKVLDLAD